MVESPGWLRLPRALLAALLASDDLATTCEVRLLQAAILWALANLSPAVTGVAAVAPSQQQQQQQQPAAAEASSRLGASSAIAVAEAAAAYRAALDHTGAASAGADLHGTPADALLPPLTPPLLKEVRALLADVSPSLRLAQMPLHVLRCATLAALVPAELTLPAVFHKLALEQEHTGAALMGSHRPPSLALNQGWAPTAAAQAGSTAGFQLLDSLAGEASGSGSSSGSGSGSGSGSSGSPSQAAARAMAADFLMQRSAEESWRGAGAGELPAAPSALQSREQQAREQQRGRESAGRLGSSLGNLPSLSTHYAAAGSYSREGSGSGGLLGPSLHSPFSFSFPSSRAPQLQQPQQPQQLPPPLPQPQGVFYTPGRAYDRDTLAVLAGIPLPPPTRPCLPRLPLPLQRCLRPPPPLPAAPTTPTSLPPPPPPLPWPTLLPPPARAPPRAPSRAASLTCAPTPPLRTRCCSRAW